MGTIAGSVLNAKNFSVLPCYFGSEKPLCEGPRILPIRNLSFAQTQRYAFDYSNEMKTGRISMIQSVFIDASNLGNGPGPIMVEMNTGQMILANPRTQGFYPVLATEPFVVVIECLAGGLATVIFTNFVVPPCVWESQAI